MTKRHITTTKRCNINRKRHKTTEKRNKAITEICKTDTEQIQNDTEHPQRTTKRQKETENYYKEMQSYKKRQKKQQRNKTRTKQRNIVMQNKYKTTQNVRWGWVSIGIKSKELIEITPSRIRTSREKLLFVWFCLQSIAAISVNAVCDCPLCAKVQKKKKSIHFTVKISQTMIVKDRKL